MKRGNDINSSTHRKLRKLESDMINKALIDAPSTSCTASNVTSNKSAIEIVENDSHASTFDQDEIDAELSNEMNDFDETSPTDISSEEENTEVLPLLEQQGFLINENIDNYDNEEIDFKAFLASWAVKENISQASLRTLLKGIKQYTCNNCHRNIPCDPRTLLHTPRSVNIRNCADGEYCHFSLLKSVKDLLSVSGNATSIKISINIDGLPLSKSSHQQLWPILGSIGQSKQVFIIGAYYDKCVLKQLENDNFDLPTTTPSKDSINTTAITQFERYIIRKLLDIEHKVSSIQDRQRNMNSKMDYIQNQMQTFGLDDNKINKNDVESDYMELFPVETLEKLQELDQLLINKKINHTALMKQLARIGGTDIKSITFNIIRRIMSDSVGSMFSYVGGKKKQSFFDLHLRKILFGAVRIYYPEATDQNISDPIKSWLRHASERNHKKNSKKSLIQDDQYAETENMDINAKSIEQDNQETDDEDEID